MVVGLPISVILFRSSEDIILRHINGYFLYKAPLNNRKYAPAYKYNKSQDDYLIFYIVISYFFLFLTLHSVTVTVRVCL